MPIVAIEIVGGTDEADRGTAESLAQRLADALGAAPGAVWVKVEHVPASGYAENGPSPCPLPVFVRVLSRVDDETLLAQRAQRIAVAVATVVDRPPERVHVIFEPDARGRVFFGGQPDAR
jgi:phenylpyruvate tautomerase PptA (4-oxalocrotonate tautomerase family)